MGNSKELSYLQSQLIRQGENITETMHQAQNITNYHSNHHHQHNDDITHFLTYSSIINEGRTSDGIRHGGQRLAYEINTWIQQLRQQIHTSDTTTTTTYNENTNIQWDISLSLIGNSLGGLYARYALKDIQFQYHVCGTSSTSTSTSRTIQPISSILHPAVFVTTCTPHLGVGKDQSYLPHVPHWIQLVIAKGIGPTGYDLFRIPTTTTTPSQSKPESLIHASTSNTTTVHTTGPITAGVTTHSDILQEMAFSDDFIQPLQTFHRRIALGNTYRTDLQVPCSTATFLTSPPISSDDSKSDVSRQDYYYHISDWNDKLLNDATHRKSCISLIVETARNGTNHDTTTRSIHQPCTSNEMAHQLDSLGWMKIFCDTRPYLPYIPIPTVLYHVRTMFSQLVYTIMQCLSHAILLFPSTASTKSNENIAILTEEMTPTSDTNHPTPNAHYYSTRDIWARFILDDDSNTQYFHDQRQHLRHRWYVPFGHTVVVANAKNEWYGRMNAAGQPTMDEFTKIILHEILQSSVKTE
jgi:Putative serine esterase (DUF676)